MFLSIYHLSIFLSIYLFTMIYLSPIIVYLYFCGVFNSSITVYLSIYLSFCLSANLSILLSICQSIYPTVYLLIYLSKCLSANLSILLSICLSVNLSILVSICQSIYLPLLLRAGKGQNRWIEMLQIQFFQADTFLI